MTRGDLTGQRFGQLTVIEDSGQRRGGCVLWRCRCDCGREADVYAASPLHGLTRSCLNHEHRVRMHEYMHYGNDTCVERLTRAGKNEAENKAGFRGLSLMRDGRYRAVITFRKVHYHLGCYRDFDEAVQARLEAERTLHQGYINAYGAYQRQAAADPAWAEANPFVYQVARTDKGFQIYTNAEPVTA